VQIPAQVPLGRAALGLYPGGTRNRQRSEIHSRPFAGEAGLPRAAAVERKGSAARGRDKEVEQGPEGSTGLQRTGLTGYDKRFRNGKVDECRFLRRCVTPPQVSQLAVSCGRQIHLRTLAKLWNTHRSFTPTQISRSSISYGGRCTRSFSNLAFDASVVVKTL